MPRLHLTRLEDRAVPAVATWDGGGADAKWTTAANWAGDAAPQPNDDLVFPAGTAQLAPTNDFPAATAFGRISIRATGYLLAGNRVALGGGIALDHQLTTGGVTATVALPLTLTAPQTIAGSYTYDLALTGPIDLGATVLTVAPAGGTVRFTGVVSGTGGLTVGTGVGVSVVLLAAANTYTGPTTVLGSVLQVAGSVAGPVAVVGGQLIGNGRTGPVTVTAGSVQPSDGYATPTALLPGTLTTGDVSFAPNTYAFFGTADRGPAQLRVTGTVRLGGFLGAFTNAALPAGTVSTVIANDGTDPVVGTFDGLPEGAFAMDFQRISYRGGDGNDVTLTAVPNPAYAVAAGAGGRPQVNVYDRVGRLIRSFLAYDAGFRGGVRVATASLTDDGIPDVVTVPGPGGGPVVRVWDGLTGALVREFLAYDANFRGGLTVAAADIVLGGSGEIVTGVGPGGGPHVKVFDARGGLVTEFLAYATAFTGGVNVAAVAGTGDRYGTIPGQVVTAPGAGGGPDVRVYSVAPGYVRQLAAFAAYDLSFRGGVNVAYDPSHDAIVTAPGAGGGPVVRGFSTGGSLSYEFLAYDAGFRGGVTVAVRPANTSDAAIVTGPGAGGRPLALQYRTTDRTLAGRGTRSTRLPRRHLRRLTAFGSRRFAEAWTLLGVANRHMQGSVMPHLHLTRLETRLTPRSRRGTAAADDKWTTAANWIGDVAPQPNDDLVFPAGARQLVTTNDFAAGTAFGKITLTDIGYRLLGNAVALAGGIDAGGGDRRQRHDLRPAADADRRPDVYRRRQLHRLEFNGGLGGPGNLTAAGAGEFLVLGDNTLAGTITATGAQFTLNSTLAGPVRIAAGVFKANGGSAA
ncbi:MAG: hypothetical protein U0746_17985 [Gemmataceae bacterium]